MTGITGGLDGVGTLRNCHAGIGADCVASLTSVGLDLVTYRLPGLSAYSGKHVSDWYKMTSAAGYNALYSGLGVGDGLLNQWVAELAKGPESGAGLC